MFLAFRILLSSVARVLDAMVKLLVPLTFFENKPALATKQKRA